MEKTLESYELEKQKLFQQLALLGDFRPGTITASYRKCGKMRCVCAQKDHLGHGPQYLCTSKVDGKSVTDYLRLGPELEKAVREVGAHEKFDLWRRQYVELNTKICRLRPVPEIEDERELETLKKKLRAKFARK